MPVNIVQVKEYECIKCGYKWINRKNGQDQSVPKRCAKCKQDWDKGNITRKESKVRYQLRFTVGEWKIATHPLIAGRRFWRTDSNVDELLKYRPSIRDMKIILQPMCYLFENSKVLYDERYKEVLLEKLDLSERQLKSMKRNLEDGSVKDWVKARDYQLQLSRKLVEYFLEKYSVPYQQQATATATQ
jgi:hypothetical protein